MKTTISTLAFVCVASFLFMGGCLKNITSVKFDYNSECTFVTDSLNTTGNQTFGSSVITSELNAEIEKNGTSLDLIDELKLKSATIGYTVPDSSKNFDKVESFELWLSADGLPTIKVASKNPVADGSLVVKFDVSNTDNLLSYIKAPTFTFEVTGKNSETLLPMDLKVNAFFEIKASSKE